MDGFLAIVLLVLLAVFISIIVFSYIAKCCYPEELPSSPDEAAEQGESLVKRKNSAWRVENFGSWNTLSGSCYAEYPPEVDTIREKVTLEDEARRASVSSRGSRKRSFSREVSRDTVDTAVTLHDFKTTSSLRDKRTLGEIAEDTSTAVGNNKQRRKGGVTQSVYELEYCDPVNVGALININKVEMKTKELQDEVNNFPFINRGVEYYKLIENILRLKIDLYAVDCTQADVKTRRNIALKNIDDCQLILSSKCH
ncbi:unnamed protein product [Acanthoscelides obtectus]|uniref:Uncharacterized protein n=1 Tax=Acanthoscelides obtectus TaxID=200917 RepID=A0A9P0JI52_ACAOB|nr:unnamed protein product [Acanthoscelides obtectus]CAK1661444.1 hypothetical protein AOBTE_LOCUS22627 [Acanthoscelides obtectus]